MKAAVKKLTPKQQAALARSCKQEFKNMDHHFEEGAEEKPADAEKVIEKAH